MYSVYKHTCPNGKVYIGITMNKPERRWQGGAGYKTHTYFYRAILKYGWNNIEHSVLYTDLTKEEAEKKEIDLIAFYKSNQKEYGYNIANGGNTRGKTAQETKIKISNSLKGHAVSAEAKKKMSEKGKLRVGEKNPNFGVKMSDEQKKKISESLIGFKHSEETKAKMRGIHAGTNHPNIKPVRCVETGENFSYAKEAAQKYNISLPNLINCCRGKRKTAGNYHWEYIEVKDSAS